MRSIAIIPVWRNPEIAGVIENFDGSFVDEICVVIDEPGKEIIKKIREAGEHSPVPKVNLIKNSKRSGVGHAIREGIDYALENGYDVVVVMAGNGKDDPREIPKFLGKIIEGCDYVQGSRFLHGGVADKTPFLRGVFIRLWPYFWRMITRKGCTDVTNGFRAYKTEILRDKRIRLDQQWLDHYALEYYLHYKVLSLGYKLAEVPVKKVYAFRHKGGYSKISPLRDWIHIALPPVLLWLKVRD